MAKAKKKARLALLVTVGNGTAQWGALSFTLRRPLKTAMLKQVLCQFLDALPEDDELEIEDVVLDRDTIQITLKNDISGIETLSKFKGLTK